MLRMPIVVVLLGFAGVASSAQQLHPPGLGERGNEASIAVDINASGQVAGIIEEESGRQRAVLWNKRLVELGTLGGSDSFTTGINVGGDAVGSAQDGVGHWRAFVSRAGLAMRDL